MDATIITIGDEILIGQVVDTNSGWIAARLNEAGLTVRRKLTIGDERGEIVEAIGDAMRRSRVVVTTGGLGPTKDDITKTTLAAMFGCGMVRDEATLERNRLTLAARGIDYNELNRSQAMVPECCTVLPNANGTAPGMWFEREGSILVSLPGVPFEMEALMLCEVMPRLRESLSLRSVVHKTMITYGLAESLLAEKIAPWEDALPSWMRLAYLPSPSQMRLRLSAYDVAGREEAEEIERRFVALEALIPDYFVGYGDDTLVCVVARELTSRGQTLAVAESCTAGMLSAGFTALPGASEYFRGGVVSYAESVKEGVLGVGAGTLSRHGAVSRETAEEMARGVMALCGTDYAIATTGVAGPTGGTERDPVGTVWIAVASREGIIASRFSFGRLRKQNIERAVAAAVNMLRLVLSGANN